MAAGGANDFVIVWESGAIRRRRDGDSSVFGQHFDSSGTPLGTEFQVNTYTPGFQEIPAIAAAGPDFAVIWQSRSRTVTGMASSGSAS